MSFFLTRYEELGEKVNPEIELKKSIRINGLKAPQNIISRLTKQKIDLQKIDFLKQGYYYESDFSLGATNEYLQGFYYLQEAVSQLPAEILAPNEKDMVLDMCAAPGGKTTQLAQSMKNKGVLVALDIQANRLESLRNNIERLGVKNTILFKKDARFADDFGKKFDKILLDAPCSGNYADEPNFFEMKSIEGVKERARLQKELLKSAYRVLKKGGEMIYSTCSLEPEENEENIDWFLKKYTDMSLQKIDVDFGDSGLTNVFGKELDSNVSLCKRFWPHKHNTQGFFIAYLKKSD